MCVARVGRARPRTGAKRGQRVLFKKKYRKEPSNIVYNIDGASYGMDDRLVEAVRASVRSRMEKGTLDIPRLPKAAARILQLSQSPDVQISAVTDAVKSDPLLAARLLKLCNAAAFGGNGEVTNLDAAIVRLGLKKVRDLVFAESLQTKVFPARSYRGLLEKSWMLSLGAAVACEEVGKATGLERDGAFLIGLLHDTGKPTLVNTLVEYEKKNGGKAMSDDLVEIVLSQLHEEIGAYVLQKWEMPASFVEAARQHHRYQESGKVPDAHRMIYAANLMCEHLGVGEIQRSISFNLERVFADLGLPLDKVEEMLDRVSAQVEDLLSGFGGMAGARG